MTHLFGRLASELARLSRLDARLRAAWRERRGARRGFTLIEALVAFVILTLSMGALMQGLGGGARNEARGDFLLRAAREGRSQLEALGVATPLTQGETSGRYGDGLAWRLSVRQIRDAAGADGAGRTIAYLARLTVRRPGEGPTESLTLTTVKLATTKPRR
jgi:general secretion pathway protein I